MDNACRQQWLRNRKVAKEKPDPTPVEVPVNMKQPPTLREEMMQFIRNELSKQAAEDGMPTFEEFDDFSLDDDEEDDLVTPYTVIEMKPVEGEYALEPTQVDDNAEDTSEPLSEGDPSPGEMSFSGEAAENTEPARLTNEAT